jgi:hypothetical protein
MDSADHARDLRPVVSMLLAASAVAYILDGVTTAVGVQMGLSYSVPIAAEHVGRPTLVELFAVEGAVALGCVLLNLLWGKLWPRLSLPAALCVTSSAVILLGCCAWPVASNLLLMIRLLSS